MKESEKKTTEPVSEETVNTPDTAQKTQSEIKEETKPVKVEAQESSDDQSAKFAMTVRQVWNLVKGFCSKDAVNTIASQCEEKLPIWAILLPVYALLSAISATVSFNANGAFKSALPSLAGAKTTYGSGEVFFITFALNLTLVFALSLGVRSFIKFHKGDGHFLSSANLVTASYLPVMFVLAFNIITVGAISSLLEPITNLAGVASTMLLFAGVSKALGGKKPIWTFFLMIIIASVVSVIAAMIFVSPIIFSRFAYSLIETLK